MPPHALTGRLLAVCLLALSAWPLPAQMATPQTPTMGAISGVVVDAVSGAPVPGARVTLGNTVSGGPPLPQMVTDAKGRFVFRDLPPLKTYYLGANRLGYAYTRYGWTGPGQSLAIRDILTINVEPGGWVQDIKIPLWQYGTISGRVVDERNEPVVGVAVRAYSERMVAGRPLPVLGPLMVTDDRGVYRLTDIGPGRYLVGVLSVQSTVLATTREDPITAPVGALGSEGVGRGRGAFVAAPSVDVNGTHRLAITNFAPPPPPSAEQSRAYPIVFYPAAPKWADAQAIDIGYGGRRTGIDMQIVPVPAVTVSGRAHGAEGEMPELLLRLMPVGSEPLGFGAEAATTPLAADGTFTFLNVPAGDYTLLAQAGVVDLTTGSAHIRLADAPGYPGEGTSVGSGNGTPGLDTLTRSGKPSAFWARIPVSVGNRPITNLALPLRRSAVISGRVVFDAGTPALTGTHGMRITAEPASGDTSLGELVGEMPANDPDHSFSVGGLLGGTYRITNKWFAGYGVVSVTAEGRDVTTSGFDGSLGRDFTDVAMTLTDKRPVVSGVVRDNQGPARAAVFVFPVDPQLWADWGWEPMWLKSTSSGGDGAFTVTNLRAGEYFAVAVSRELKDAWTQPKVLAAASVVATRFTLRWGDKQTLDLQLKELVVK